MKHIGKLAIGALMLAGSALGATLATTAPADARVSIGIGIGGPGYYGNPCRYARYRYYHPRRCGYGYGPGYGVGGIWITDSFGHRHWRGGHGGFHGGFHGRWNGGGHWHHHH